MKDDELDIRPGVGMLALFPAMSYKPWNALAELVDNAIQSYLNEKARLFKAEGSAYQLTVKISLDSSEPGSLRVWDNAGGIAIKDYHRAFITGEPPADTTGLSQFGIGMKSACCWFARKWSVRTKAIGEDVERTVLFDVPKIVRTGTERLTPKVKPAERGAHYTEISMRDLNRPLVKKTVGKMKDHLTSMYRIYLRRGEVEIYFNDDKLRFEEPDELVAPAAPGNEGPSIHWRKRISFEISGGRTVEGFAALRKEGSTALAGLALFRNDRLIMGSNDEPYRPHEVFGGSNSYSYQRLFGELRLANVDVSHTKDTFIWGDFEEKFLDRLRKELDAAPKRLIYQADHYRSRQTSKAAAREMERATERTAAAVAALGPAVAELERREAGDGLPGTVPNEVPVAAGREVMVDVEGEKWRVTLELSKDPASTTWLDLFDTEVGRPGSRSADGKQRRVGIRLALDHPFTREFAGASGEHIESMWRIAVGLALSEITARESGVKLASEIRARLNELLRDELAKPADNLLR